MAFTNVQLNAPISVSGTIEPDFEVPYSVSGSGTLSANISQSGAGFFSGTWTFTGSATATNAEFGSFNTTFNESGNIFNDGGYLRMSDTRFEGYGLYSAGSDNIALDALVFVSGAFGLMGVWTDTTLHGPNYLPPIVSIDSYDGTVEEGGGTVTVTLKRFGT